jgi:hypothetical protein
MNRKERITFGIAGGLTLLAVLAVALWPHIQQRRDRIALEKSRAEMQSDLARIAAQTEQWRRETQILQARNYKWPESRIMAIEHAHASGGSAAAQILIDQWTPPPPTLPTLPFPDPPTTTSTLPSSPRSGQAPIK